MFGTEGKVTKIYVKEGQKVKAGQLLAELDKEQLNISLSLGIQNARINYDKLINQYTAADILNAQNNVDGAQTKLTVAKNELVTLQSQQGDTVQTSSPKIQTIISTMQNIVNDGKDMLKTIDEIFNITKKNTRYADQQVYISAWDSSLRSTVELNHSLSNTKLIALESALSSVKGKSAVVLTNVKDLSSKAKDFLTVLYSANDSSINAVNASIDGVALSSLMSSRTSIL